MSKRCPLTSAFSVGSHVKLLRSCGEYYYGKVLDWQATTYRNECCVQWDDDGAVSWVPTYKLEQHGVETELGWDVT